VNEIIFFHQKKFPRLDISEQETCYVRTRVQNLQLVRQEQDTLS